MINLISDISALGLLLGAGGNTVIGNESAPGLENKARGPGSGRQAAGTVAQSRREANTC